MPDSHAPELVHFRSADISLIVENRDDALPRIVHWGPDLGELTDDDLSAFVLAQRPQRVTNALDTFNPVEVVPAQARGWLGTPGLSGHRDGTAFSTLFQVTSSAVEADDHAGQGRRLLVAAADRAAALELDLQLELTPSGLLRQRATVRNAGAGTYTVDGLVLSFPVPARATELLDLTGRHLRERSPQRAPFTAGTHVRENRRGRTALDSSLLLMAGGAGFGHRRGDVWGVHVAWSGNHRMLAERMPNGECVLTAGELLLPGEIRLATGEEYTTPWVYGAYGDGLDALSHRFHTHLRSRPAHPRSARPVTLNTWEAVYFDHDESKLKRLAEVGAEVGVERFVLDDGWFRHRRAATAGLGDWYVDETVWPEGLHPLVDHVNELGMEFGLWVEPEMINADSDLARAHPDWIMRAGDRLPLEFRHQQVLDLGNADAYAYILERLDALLSEYRIGYVKWDHNRDLVEAGHAPAGATSVAGVHRQTASVYRLIEELRARHPGVEIESCSSGGGRVDLGILERTQRIWTSDCNDALERQRIQRWTGLLVPPEMMGAHVGPGTSHSTGRTHRVDFRAGTALFGHLGIEWDITTATDDELSDLAAWVELYKQIRPLLHTGDVVHADHPDPAVDVHGVVAADRSRAVFAIVQNATSLHAPVGPVRLPGLDPHARYRLAPLPPGDVLVGATRSELPWWRDGVVLPGRVLGENGVQAPTLHPERLVLVEAHRVA